MAYDFAVIGDRGLGTQEKILETDDLDEALNLFNSRSERFLNGGWTTLELLFFSVDGSIHVLKAQDIDDVVQL